MSGVKLIGADIDWAADFLEKTNADWFVIRRDSVDIDHTRQYYATMIEVDNNIITRVHYEGLTYDGKKVEDNGDRP